MDKKNLFELYEKLYFHEIDRRDKIIGRLQLPLAIFVSILSILGVMVRNINYDLEISLIFKYFSCLAITITTVTFGLYYFIRAFYGHEYKYIPTASETEKYNKELHETYEEFDEGEELAEGYLSDYLYKDYHECSSANSNVNDNRSEYIHRSNFFIILSIVPLLITFLVFNFAQIDKNNKDKVQKISIAEPLSIDPPKQPIDVKIVDNELLKDVHKSFQILIKEVKNMADKEKAKIPPPPPPPPPKRVIREDIQLGIKKEKPSKDGDK
jgi:hypothetical protein